MVYFSFGTLTSFSPAACRRARPNHSELGLTTVALPASVRRSFSSESRALARSIDSLVVSIQPAPISSPVRTLPACKSSSCCSMLACSCLHHAMKRSGAATSFSATADVTGDNAPLNKRLLFVGSREEELTQFRFGRCWKPVCNRGNAKLPQNGKHGHVYGGTSSSG